MIKKSSFTLIELIVVIAIIAILAAVVAPNAYKAIEKAQAASTGKSYKSIKTSVLSHYVDTGLWAYKVVDCVGSLGSVCTTYFENSFFMIDTGELGWDGPYLNEAPGANPFGGEYVYMIGLGIYFTDYPETVLGVQNISTRVVTAEIGDIKRQQKVDAILDDGNLLTGAMRNASSSNISIGEFKGTSHLLLLVSCDDLIREENPEADEIP